MAASPAEEPNLESKPGRRERLRRRRREAVRLADLTTVGLVFPVAVIIGFLAGRWIGGLFGHGEAGGYVGGALGLVSGFYNVYKVSLQLAKQDGSDPSAPDS